MRLEFDVKSIDSFGGMLGWFTAGGSPYGAPSSYLQEHGSMGIVDSGVLNPLRPAHEDTYEYAVTTFDRLSDVFWNSQREVQDAADQYAETEQDNHDQVWGAGARLWTLDQAERADNSIGAVRRPPADRATPGPRDFEVDPHPYRHLDRADNPVPGDPADVAPEVRKVLDLISPSSLVAQGVKKLIGWDPFELVSEGLAGDWERFGRFADMWKRLDASMGDLSNRVWKGNRTLDEVWHGNAADMCFEYHHRLAFAIKALQKPLSTLAQSYQLIAVHVAANAAIINDLLKQIVDTLTFTLLGMIVPEGAVPAWLVVTVKRVRDLATKVLVAMDGLTALIGGLAEKVAEAGLDIAAFQRSFLPADDYHSWVRGR